MRHDGLRQHSTRQGTWGEAIKSAYRWLSLKASWIAVVANVVFVVGAAIFLAIAGFEEFAGQRIVLLIFGGLCTLGAAVLSFLIDQARRRADTNKAEEGAELQLAMTDAFQPILRRLVELRARPSDHHNQLLSKVVGNVLMTLPTLFRENPDLRMVVYDLDKTRGRSRQLVVHDSAGRQRNQAKAFVKGDGGRGDAVFSWIEERTARFVPDIETEDDPNWQGSGRGYRTFISVPIASQSEIFGMITLDAPAPGDLDETDVPIMVTLAEFMAVAHASRRR